MQKRYSPGYMSKTDVSNGEAADKDSSELKGVNTPVTCINLLRCNMQVCPTMNTQLKHVNIDCTVWALEVNQQSFHNQYCWNAVFKFLKQMCEGVTVCSMSCTEEGRIAAVRALL